MRIFAVFIVCILLCLNLFGQQKPHYTQYILNNYIVNPAISGIENYIDVKAGYRQQWSGIQNAPETSYITAHMPVGKSDERTNVSSFSMVGENPLGYSYKDEYMAAEAHHGVGIMALIDKTGPIQQSVVNLTYAYHLGLSAKMNLSVGVGVGINKISLNADDIILENPNDQAVNSGLINQLKPDLNIGLWLYASTYFIGISAQQLLMQDLSFTGVSSPNPGKTVPHYFATAGYRFWLSDDITVVPSIMLNGVKDVPITANYNMKLAFRDKFWLGGSLRQGDSAAAMLGFNLSSLVNVGYSYDFTSSQLNRVTTGTHEIVLGLTLNNRYRVTCPQKLW